MRQMWMKTRRTPAVIVTLVLVGVITLAVAGVATVLVLRDRAGDSANGSAPVDRLEQLAGTWRVAPAGTLPGQIIDATRITLTIGAGRLDLETGCNPLRTKARISQGRLVILDMARTEMGCTPDWAAQEGALAHMLDSKPRIELSGPYLYLHWGEGEKYWITFEKTTRS